MYAQRKQWPLRAVHVDVRFTREGKEGAIARVLSFEGELDDAQRTRLADIAERTPVTLTLMQGVPITTIGLTLPVACRLRAGVGRPDSGGAAVDAPPVGGARSGPTARFPGRKCARMLGKGARPVA
jgi:hypothetical protein